jgi:hypothetical protein
MPPPTVLLRGKRPHSHSFTHSLDFMDLIERECVYGFRVLGEIYLWKPGGPASIVGASIAAAE